MANRFHRQVPAEVPDPAALSGTVSKAPTKAEGPFEVVIPSFSTDHATEIRRWMPRGETLPKVGDEVLVLEDENFEPWVIAWWPG